MLQLSEFLIGNSAECFIRVLVTSDPRAARLADVALGSEGSAIDLFVIDELSWRTTIGAAPATKHNRIILEVVHV